MPRLKNGRQKKKQKAKQRLVVAMISKTSLRSKTAKQSKEKDAEQEKHTESESVMNLRPKRTKPQKEAIDKEAEKGKTSKKKPVKRLTTKKGKKKAKATRATPKSKATKRKSKTAENISPKKQKIEDVEEMLTEFDGIQSYEELKECEDIETLVVATNPRQRSPTKGKSPSKKRSRPDKNIGDHAAQIIVEAVPEALPKNDSDDDDDAPEEDDDDIDDSLFFGIPTERSPEFGNCTHCKKKFRREELVDHVHNCPERYVQCRECNKVLSNLQTLERHHKRFHLKLREVPCTLCDKMFIDEAASRKHLKTVHFKVKNFHCPHCDKSFSQRNKLTYHVRTHSGEKPFACPECGRSFSLLWNLKTHLRTHTGEKPYACDICGRKFTQKQNMTSHMTTHKKPKMARTNSFSSFTRTDNLDYFSMSDLRQSGKANMVHENQTSFKISHSRSVGQGTQYVINQLGSMTATSAAENESAASVITISQNNELENGLGLLSSVARKGDDNTLEGISSNVEVDCIVDEAHLANQVAHSAGVDQVVEVLVQPQGGSGDTTITLSTSDIATSQETEHNTSRDAANAVSTSVAGIQQQQQAVGTQNVIPIGNANLSGLANILQNPEVLAAINAAAATNKFIVIGPVGMLSGQNAGTTNTVSIATAYSHDTTHASDSEAMASLASNGLINDKQSQPTLSQSNRPLMQIATVDNVDSGLPASCDVEMIPADTSQDTSVQFAGGSDNNESATSDVQSSVPNIVNLMLQGTSSVTASSNLVSDSTIHSYALSSEQGVPCQREEQESEVVSSQDSVFQEGVNATSSGDDGEQVSSSAEKDGGNSLSASHKTSNQADSSKDKEAVQSSSGVSSFELGNVSGGAVFDVNIAASYMNDDKLVTQSTDNTAANINADSHILNQYSTAETTGVISVPAQSQESDIADNSEAVSQSYIVSLGEQFVSSSTRSSLANASFITSSGLSGNGQSMVMVTADGQSYLTTLTLPDGFQQAGNQQIILADSMSNNFSIPVVDGSIALDSLANLQPGDSSSNALFTAHFQNTGNELHPEPGSCSESIVTDSTPRIIANSSSTERPTHSLLVESDLESSVSGSNQIQQQVGNSLDDRVNSNSADADQGITAQTNSIPDAYVANSSATDFNAYQQALMDAADIVTGSSTNYDGVVSGTENIVPGDSLGNDQLEAQRTGVTSSNLLDNNAEALTVSNDVEQGDSYVSTSLQVS